MMCFTLLKHRRIRRWTQVKLAKRAGIGVSTIARLEQGTYGRHGPDLASLRAIARVFGKTVDELFPELLDDEEKARAS